MQLADVLSLLALRQISPSPTTDALAERLRGAGSRLTGALQHALHRAWQALEVVLAGDGFWDGCQVFLDAAACTRLKQQVQLLRTAALPGKSAGRASVLRPACGRELRALRRAGLLTPAGGTGERLAEHAPLLAPDLPDAEAELLRRLRDELRRVQAPTLATLFDSTPGSEPPLLLVAVRCLLRQEILAQPELTQLLPLDERRLAPPTQMVALMGLCDLLVEHGRGLQEWLAEDATPAPSRAAGKSAAQQAQQGDTGSAAAAPATATASAAAAAAPGAAAPPPADADPGGDDGKKKYTPRQRLLAAAVVLACLAVPALIVFWFFQLHAVREVQRFEGHEKPVTAVALSADGKLVLSAGLDRTLRVWDAETGKELRRLEGDDGHKQPVYSVLFAPEGRLALAISEDRATLWDVDAGKLVNGIYFQEGVSGHGYFLKGAAYLLTFNGRTHDCIVWRIDQAPRPGGMFKTPLSSRILKFPGPKMAVYSIAIDPEGKHIAFGGYRDIVLYEVVTGKEVARLEGHTDIVLSLAFSPDGKRLVSGGEDLALRLWNLETGKTLAKREGKDGHHSQVVCVAFAPDGKRVLTGSTGTKGRLGEKKDVTDRRTLRVWEITDPDPRTGEVFLYEERLFEVPYGAIRAAAFSAEGDRVVSGGDDLCVRLWQLPR